MRLEGTIVNRGIDDEDGVTKLILKGGNILTEVSKEEMQHAELVSTPVTFTREQIEAIKEKMSGAWTSEWLIDWLEEREEDILRLE